MRSCLLKRRVSMLRHATQGRIEQWFLRRSILDRGLWCKQEDGSNFQTTISKTFADISTFCLSLQIKTHVLFKKQN